MPRLLIGVVVPTYNSKPYIEAALASIAAQTATNFHCCVVDDGSTDGTLDLVRELTLSDRRFTVVAQSTGGVAQARNRGLAQLAPSTDFLTFFDHDDVWAPEALDCLLTAISADPLCIGAHALAEYIDKDGSPLQPGFFAGYGRDRHVFDGRRMRSLLPTEPTSFRSVLPWCTVFPPALILTRSIVYQRVGFFDPRLVPADDWDMLIRLARYGHFVFVNRVIMGYRWHGANQGLTPKMRLANAEVRRAAVRCTENSLEQHAQVREAWRGVQILHAADRSRRGWCAIRQGRWKEASAEFARVLLAGARYVVGRPSRFTFDGR